MKAIKTVLVSAVLLFAASYVFAQEDEQKIDTYSIWLGGHYVEFSDNSKKVGEFMRNDNDLFPEMRAYYLSRFTNGYFRFDGHYFDDENINATLSTTISNRFDASFGYRSLTRQKNQNNLEAMQAREYLPTTSSEGGKMLTHEVTDPGADYNTHRQEILSRLQVLLSEKGNVRLVAAHRTILEDGTEQKISSNHCFSCHLSSEAGKVENRIHEISGGIEAEVQPFDLPKMDIGYQASYREYQSNAPDATAFYDAARHPVNGGSAEEFRSRVIYENAELPYAVSARVQKQSHKVRLASPLSGKGYALAGSFGYAQTENTTTDLSYDAYFGALNYAMLISPKTRLVAKLSGLRMRGDDPFVDIPLYREGRPGPTYDFDFTRWSSLDRKEGKVSAEVITRMSPRLMLSILAGYEQTDRDDYPVADDGWSTKKFIGQVKANYSKGLRYSTRLKYRLELTKDPFTSGRGLFEARGYDELAKTYENSTIFSFIFYFEREQLRYQSVTSLPTQAHIFEWSSKYRPNNQVDLNIGVKGQYDKNGDLDSLDVQHFSIQPNLFVNYMPDMKWVFSGGYSYNLAKSKVPVAMPLFDG